MEATLIEMDSCMRLLFPEFDLADIQTTISSPPNSQPANEYPSIDEQPCCSKDLRNDRREGMIQEEVSREEENSNVEGKRGKEDKGMTEEMRNSRREEKKGKEKERSGDEEGEDKERRDGNEQVEKKGEEVEDREQKKLDMKEAQSKGEEEEDEDGSGDEEEEEPLCEDLFIRNSGLISHSYSLDLNLIPGRYNSTRYM